MTDQEGRDGAGTENSTEAPMTALGEAVQGGESGELTLDDVLAVFLESDLWLPSVVDPSEGGVQPVVGSARPGETLVAAFDSAESAREVADLASFAVPISARELLGGLTDDLGLSIGTAGSGLIIDAETCQRLRASTKP